MVRRNWLIYNEELGYSHGKSTLKLNFSAYEKYEHGYLGHWYIKLTFFLRGSKTETNFPKK